MRGDRRGLRRRRGRDRRARLDARHRAAAGALITRAGEPTAVPFSELGLPDALVDALERAGITTAFPIQSATIADALAGRDVLGKARTGSGKTLAFGLPAIARLAESGRAEPNKPKAVVLVPTRELAMQVNDALEPYAHAMHVSIRLVAGGLSMSKQIMALERGVHLLVATPGRLADLARRGHADMSAVELVVLDEADHMADMGFMDEITEILATVPAGGQRLLFSATLDGDVDRLVSQYMSDPATHDVTGGEGAPMKVSHVVLNVPPNLKYQTANRIAARDGRTIVFVRTKLAADRIAEDMRASGVLAVALHGDKSQAERNNAITGFRAGSIPVLVATDVAARGIHVDSVDLVLQLDPPADHKDYTHRSGRTARAGESGVVVTLVLPHQRRQTDRLLEMAGVEANFRKVRGEDAESLALVDALTGGREPSGVPVAEPRLPRAARGRPERGGRGAGRDRPHRPTRREDGRREPRRDDGAASAREDVARRERELADRERALAQREQELRTREQRVTAPSARAERPSYQRPDRPNRDRPNRDRPARDGDAPRRTGGKPWEDRKRDDRPARDERPARTGGKPWDKRTRDDRPARGGEAPRRTGGKPWEDRKREGAAKDATPERKQRWSSDARAKREGDERRSAPRDSDARPEKTRKKSDGGKKGKGGAKGSSRRGQPRPKKKH